MHFSVMNILCKIFAVLVGLCFFVGCLAGLGTCQQTHLHDSNPPEGVQTPVSGGQSANFQAATPPHAVVVVALPNEPGQPTNTSTIVGAIGPAVQPAQPSKPINLTSTPPTIMQVQEEGNITVITTRPAPPTSAPATQPMRTVPATEPK
jgi:hypothetical protein